MAGSHRGLQRGAGGPQGGRRVHLSTKEQVSNLSAVIGSLSQLLQVPLRVFDTIWRDCATSGTIISKCCCLWRLSLHVMPGILWMEVNVLKILCFHCFIPRTQSPLAPCGGRGPQGAPSTASCSSSSSLRRCQGLVLASFPYLVKKCI